MVNFKLVSTIETIPGIPTSHPFIERSTGLCRQEFLDHALFWNAEDLAKKLDQYQSYLNETRAHSSLNKKTPIKKQQMMIFQIKQCPWKISAENLTVAECLICQFGVV